MEEIPAEEFFYCGGFYVIPSPFLNKPTMRANFMTNKELDQFIACARPRVLGDCSCPFNRVFRHKISFQSTNRCPNETK